jgi:hypothetical protein
LVPFKLCAVSGCEAGGYDRSAALEASEEAAKGTTEETGSGAYLLNWKGDVGASAKVLAQYREAGVSEEVWQHTEKLLEEAVKR